MRPGRRHARARSEAAASGGRLRALAAALALAAGLAPLPGCFSGRSGGPLEEVQDPSVLEFAERIQSFYGAIQQIPLDVRITYESSALRSFFANDADFAAYYASLAAQLRRAQFRNATLERVLIQEFRFDGEGTARVDVMLFGRHERALRFRELELARQDIWQRGQDGSWCVTPEKL